MVQAAGANKSFKHGRYSRGDLAYAIRCPRTPHSMKNPHVEPAARKRDSWKDISPSKDLAHFCRMIDCTGEDSIIVAIMALASRQYRDKFDRMMRLLTSPESSWAVKHEVIDAFGELGEERAERALIGICSESAFANDFITLRKTLLALGKIGTETSFNEIKKYRNHHNPEIGKIAVCITGKDEPLSAAKEEGAAPSGKPTAKYAPEAEIERRKEVSRRAAQKAADFRKERDGEQILEWRRHLLKKKVEERDRRKPYLDAVSKGMVLTLPIYRKIHGPWDDGFWSLILKGNVLTSEVYYILKAGEEWRKNNR